MVISFGAQTLQLVRITGQIHAAGMALQLASPRGAAAKNILVVAGCSSVFPKRPQLVMFADGWCKHKPMDDEDMLSFS